VDVETKTGAGGYAAQQSPEYYARQQELLGQHLSGVDVIITTAAVPGRKAPVLITEAMMQGLHPGTIVVDLAAERGGNCALTEAGRLVDYRGVKILGPVNVAAQVPAHASQMYSRNIQTFLSHLVKDGQLQFNLEDEITAGTLVAHEGKITHPRVQQALEGA
jgi:NAD(P) transhydrogenase subunit alpha